MTNDAPQHDWEKMTDEEFEAKKATFKVEEKPTIKVDAFNMTPEEFYEHKEKSVANERKAEQTRRIEMDRKALPGKDALTMTDKEWSDYRLSRGLARG
ncbi:MAG: hypothetical protein KGS72_25355 [Cyanobacteria bacterium REEB67]|nr:hypothetical protein [Cyanobacteria bacterium REEB67]